MGSEGEKRRKGEIRGQGGDREGAMGTKGDEE